VKKSDGDPSEQTAINIWLASNDDNLFVVDVLVLVYVSRNDTFYT
jgi:hypothetical protein